MVSDNANAFASYSFGLTLVKVIASGLAIISKKL